MGCRGLHAYISTFTGAIMRQHLGPRTPLASLNMQVVRESRCRRPFEEPYREEAGRTAPGQHLRQSADLQDERPD